MRPSLRFFGAPLPCLALAFAASAQTAAPASVARPTAKPAEIIVGGGKPAAVGRASASPVTRSNAPAVAGTQKSSGNAEMSMLELQSLQAKRATQLQMATAVMNSASDSRKRISNNVGR